MAPACSRAVEYLCPDFLFRPEAASPEHRFEGSFSLYTHHWRFSTEHKSVKMVTLHENLPGNRLCGVSLFTNSFGQPSAYLYAGQQYGPLFGQPRLGLKLTAGILYGYVEPYKRKVPMNHNGFSPAIIPVLVYKLGARDAVELEIFGTAGVMLSYARKF